MSFVPLKLGVKINPEAKYYSEHSQNIYKQRAEFLMKEKLRKDHD